MAYQVTYNGIEGQTNIYCKIRRKLDGLWWGGGNGWVSDTLKTLIVLLPETATVPGEYTADSGIVPANGGVYVVYVYSQAGVLLLQQECVYRSRQQTILETINELQRWLRLPESGVIAEGHAQLLLGYANEVQLDYMADYCQWPEMKVKGAFDLVSGVSVNALSLLNGSKIDSIIEFRIGTREPLSRIASDYFRQLVKTSNGLNGEPTVYNHYDKVGGSLLVEVFPVPDTSYRVDFEALLKPSKLVYGADIPLLDNDTILLGMKYLAKKDQGDDYGPELATFQAKIGLQAGTHGEMNNVVLDFL